MTSNGVLIHSFQKSLPPRCVTNEDLSKLMETSDEWIQKRTGIQTRFWVDPPTTTSDLGTAAARASLALSGSAPCDCIIAATLSPDFSFPGIGVSIQHKLGLPPVPAFDLRNQCTGFLYALEMADALVRAERYRKVLVVGAEVHSTGLDITTRGRDVAVLFGDGAGSCIVEREQDVDLQTLRAPAIRLIGSELHSDGEHLQELWCEHPGSAHFPTRLTAEMVEEALVFPKMNGRKVFESAVRAMIEVSLSVLKRAKLTPAEVGLLIPHQANLRINEFVARELGLKEEQVVSTIQKYGNTTAATIPIGFSDAISDGRLKRKQVILSAAFGSGFTWGASLFEVVHIPE